MNSAADIVTEYLNKTKGDLVKSYRDKGLKASGKYEKGLTVSVEDTGRKIKAYIESEGHVWFMEKGRKPNRNQTAQAVRSLGKILEQWVKDKGISVNPYAAAHKIVHKGIDVPNRHNIGEVVTEVITDEWFNKLIEKMSEWHINVVKSEVSKIFK